MLTATVIVRQNSFDFTDPQKGQIFVVSDFDTAQKISQIYFNDFYKKPFNSLNQAVETSMAGDVIAMSYFEGVLYFSVFGNAGAQITRNGEDKIIVNNLDGPKSASGYPKEGDIITLKTPNGKISLKFDSKNVFSFNIPVKLNNKIYLREQNQEKVSPDSKRMTLIVGITLLVLVTVLAGVGINKKKQDDLKSKYNGILQEAQNNLNEAISLATSDPEKSRELFKISQTDLNKIIDMKVNDSKVADLKNKIEASRESILGEYSGEPELFLDLSLLSSGFKGDILSESNESIFVLDKNGKKIVRVEIETKKSKVTAGPSVISDPRDIASYEDSVYVLENDGVYEVDSKKNKIIDSSWNGEVFTKVFGGNMYILDKSANLIYRYIGNPQGFGEKNNWLSSLVTANFGEAKSWGIDGAVYVLYPNSKILKFSQGSPQSFRLTGIVPEIGNTDAIYADPDNNYLYLLDRAGKRVVVTDKKGSYKAQYSDDKIGEAISLVVSEKDKKIILLTGEKLLQMEIRHLN